MIRYIAVFALFLVVLWLSFLSTPATSSREVPNVADDIALSFRQNISGTNQEMTGAEITVGQDSTLASSYSLRISLDGTALLAVHLANTVERLRDISTTVTEDKFSKRLSLTGQNCSHRFYMKSPSSLEWEILLPRDPMTNRFSYGITTAGLRYCYQPQLTLGETLAGCERPAKVVGSYAVVDRSESGGEGSTIGTGKRFHIFRPKAWDSAGDSVWCSLDIDTVVRQLTVIVPQEFLDRATYPVTIDPEIGFTSAGASIRSIVDYGQANVGLPYTYVASPGDRLTEFWAHTFQYSSEQTADLAVYSMPNDTINGGLRLAEPVSMLITANTPAWHSVTGLSQPLVPGSRYAIAIGNPSGTIRISYDANVGVDNMSSAGGSALLAAEWSQTGTTDHCFSMYALVDNTSSATGEQSRRRFLIMGGR